MKDMEAVRLNEKVKRLSTLFGAGGVAAVLTSFTRWADQPFDGYIGTSLFAGTIAILVSIAINDLLVSEDENERFRNRRSCFAPWLHDPRLSLHTQRTPQVDDRAPQAA